MPSRRTRYTVCAAPGCFQTPRKFSRFCRFHAAKLERTRDLKGRVLTKGELRSARADCLDFLLTHRDHPAVAAAIAYMAEWLTPKAEAGFLHREFARVRDHGATPEELLASFMAVWMWQERATDRQVMSLRCFDLNLGRAVLGSVPARSRISRNGKKYYVRVRPGRAEALGQNLRAALGPFALVTVRKMLKDSAWHAPDERGRLILEAMKAAPFDAGEETTTEDEEE